MHKNKDFRKFPTKRQPPNKGQRACSQNVLYSEAPLYSKEPLPVVGALNINVEYSGQTYKLVLLVVKGMALHCLVEIGCNILAVKVKHRFCSPSPHRNPV